MCGIALLLQPSTLPISSELSSKLSAAIEPRGPDGCNAITVELSLLTSCLFVASVLFIQGHSITYQPCVDEKGDVLLWNGEIFGGQSGYILGEGDTRFVLSMLSRAANLNDEAVAAALSTIIGPFSLIFFHAASKKMYYGRDSFGRRSLLALRGGGGGNAVASINKKLLALCSVSCDMCIPESEWEEVKIGGIFVLHFKDASNEYDELLIPWPVSRIKLGRGGPTTTATETTTTLSSVAAPSIKFLSTLQDAVSRRVQALGPPIEASTSVSLDCRIGVLFSGGIDSVLLAAVLHTCLDNPLEPIDLINVSFYDNDEEVEGVRVRRFGAESNTPSPDRLASIAALVELQSLFPLRPWRLVHVDVTPRERAQFDSKVKSLILVRRLPSIHFTFNF